MTSYMSCLRYCERMEGRALTHCNSHRKSHDSYFLFHRKSHDYYYSLFHRRSHDSYSLNERSHDYNMYLMSTALSFVGFTD